MTSVNGRTGEFIRWVLIALFAGVTSYYTAIGAIQSRIAVVEERELNHYGEIIRRLDRLESKIDRMP
jgi:hypothetical protein